MSEAKNINAHADGYDIDKLLLDFIMLRDESRLVEAAVIGDQLTKLVPNSPTLLLDYGRILRRLGMLDKAAASFRNSAALNPDMFISILFLGHTILDQCKWHEAWQKAGFQRKPWSTKGLCDDPDVLASADANTLVTELYNLGLDLGNAGYFKESAACHQAVVRCCPEIVHAYFGFASMLLALGQFRNALPVLREWNERSRRNLNAAYWYGEDITVKTLYIYADHGLGDAMQFIRFVPLAATRCRKVLFYLPRALWKIVGEIPNVEFITEINQPFDVMCSLFMLPHVVGIDEPSLGSMVPYLSVDPALVARWGQRLPKDGFRIGIAWQGNPSSLFDQGRSIPLACYAPLAQLPGVKLVSLQMHFGLDQLASLPEGMTIITLGSDFNNGPDNVVDTAAVMKGLDLIISSDTSVPHIAGALSCPVWVLLKSAPDWRWQLEREDCPWYPTMRLFRQKEAGEWGEVMTRVVNAVVERMAGAPHANR
ncbi:MAG: tetratricopeptide repeat-containing glycosyltransferase family protein [Rhodospirillaceae bacterium]